MKIMLDWMVGCASSVKQVPDTFIPAVVPGAVQLDWARAQGWAAVEEVGNVADYDWMEDSFWRYRTRLPQFTLDGNERLFFICGGVDYQCEVRLNDELLLAHEGMFSPIELDISDAQPGDVLDVVVYPSPKSHLTRDNTQPNQSCKPAVSYGWDFHPRLVPLGIWQDAILEIRPSCHLRRAETRYMLADDDSRADITLDVSLSLPAIVRVEWELRDPDGTLIFSMTSSVLDTHFTTNASIDQPTLWWPNGQGDPVRYSSEIKLLSSDGALLDQRVARIGFRRVRLVTYPLQWDDPEVNTIPKGPVKPPITLEVNGRSIFVKGANWVSPDIFPGRISDDLLREQLDLTHAAHWNLLRCWGGAIVQNDAFFEMCDARGLMVWQEFPLACNRYEGTPAYLHVLDQESRAIITRLRTHPSLVLWCGGNELFMSWSKMTEQDAALRLLDSNCYQLDPFTPFIMTSPLMGMAHGGYWFLQWDEREVFQTFAEAHCTAYTEFGVPAPASEEMLAHIIPADELFPPRTDGAWKLRHGYNAFGDIDNLRNLWLELPAITRYFGALTSLSALVEAGQLLQAEGLKCIYEEARRQKPVCAMALAWCFNEPWPTAANNSMLSWPCHPKPGYTAVRQACRPTLASARIPKFCWRAGEWFTPELWLLHDGVEALSTGTLHAVLECGEQQWALLDWQHAGSPANTNLPGPTIRFQLPALPSERMCLRLTVEGHDDWTSEYTLIFQAGEIL